MHRALGQALQGPRNSFRHACLPACMLLAAHARPRRQQRIEASGPLGAAVTHNPYLDVVAGELEAAAAARGSSGGGCADGSSSGSADGFLSYLAALLEIERWVAAVVAGGGPGRCVCSSWAALAAPLTFTPRARQHVRVAARARAAGATRAPRASCWWRPSTRRPATGARGRWVRMARGCVRACVCVCECGCVRV
jgi:hypothetical protein